MQLNLFMYVTFGVSGSAISSEEALISTDVQKKKEVDYELKAAQLSFSMCDQSCYILLLCDLFLEIPQGHLEDRLYRQFLSLHLGISLIL